jgi:hypothetical protein
MAQLDVTSFAAALKLLYPRGLAEILYPKCPLLGWMPKKQDFYGEAAVITPMTSGVRGSTNFTSAVNNQSVPTLNRFLVTRVKDYALASIDAEAMMASANDKGAIAKGLDTQIRGALYELGRSAAFQLYSDGGGSRGTSDVVPPAGTGVATAVLQLTNIEDIVHFEVGMFVDNSVDDGNPVAAGINSLNSTEIGSVNRRLGQISTLNGLAWNNAANWGAAVADGEFIFRAGDYGNCASGVAGWVPPNDPGVGGTPAALFGVTRTTDPTRLAGIRIAGGGGVMEEVVFDAVAEAHINGAQPDTLFMNSRKFAELQKSAYAKTWMTVDTDIPGIGYKALSFPTDYGDIKVLSDPNCPVSKGYLLARDSWELKSLGEFPHFATDEGLKYMRLATSDAIEFRIRGFWNLMCDKPGHNAVITW